jgi:hypothetical protein
MKLQLLLKLLLLLYWLLLWGYCPLLLLRRLP